MGLQGPRISEIPLEREEIGSTGSDPSDVTAPPPGSDHLKKAAVPEGPAGLSPKQSDTLHCLNITSSRCPALTQVPPRPYLSCTPTDGPHLVILFIV